MARRLGRNMLGVMLLSVLMLVVGNDGMNLVVKPIPNLAAAMEGYDPAMADPFAYSDPGKKNQILVPVNSTAWNGKVTLNSFIAKASEDYASIGASREYSFTNFNNYYSKQTESTTFSGGIGIGIGVGPMLGFGLSYQQQCENTKVLNFFKKVTGEIVQKSYECRTHTVNIDSSVKPVFTKSFLSALETLHIAAKNPTAAQSEKAFVEFVEKFGTHFMKVAHLGSKVVMERRFSAIASSKEASLERQKCVYRAVDASLGFTSSTTGGSVESSFSSGSGKCSSSSVNSFIFKEESLAESKVVKIGLLPSGPLSKWGSAARTSPVPIFFELEKISNWFSKGWFSKIPVKEEKPNGEKFDGNAMRNFFEIKLANYCKVRFGKTDCNVKKTGCGYDDNCPLGTECYDTNKANPTHQCLRTGIRYSTVYISGGAANWKDRKGRPYYSDKVQAHMSLTTVKAHYRDVSAHTLTKIGKMLYICGGRQRDWRGDSYTTKDCYKYDTSSSNSKWKRIADLPKELSYHSAVATDPNIWFTYQNIWFIGNNRLYNYDVPRDQYSTFTTPFAVSGGHCSVSSDTHVYVIGVGGGQDEIHETPHNHPASWVKVGTLKDGRRVNHGCLLYGPNIYITGGKYNRRSVEVFNFVSRSVWKTNSLTDDRLGHQMMVHNGKPAVIGGHHNCNGGCTYHTRMETYDISTERWSVDTSFRLLTGVEYFGLGQDHT